MQNMKYSIIWRPHKINCTKVLIRFTYMSLTFQQFTGPKARASLAMSMNHDQTWLNGILSWDKKQTSYSFLFPEFSQVKSHSLLSSFRCLVCCRIELLWMWNGCSFTGSDSIRDCRYYQDFLGGKHNNPSYHTNHTLFSFNWSMIDKWLWLTTHHCIFPFGWRIYFWDLTQFLTTTKSWI